MLSFTLLPNLPAPEVYDYLWLAACRTFQVYTD